MNNENGSRNAECANFFDGDSQSFSSATAVFIQMVSKICTVVSINSKRIIHFQVYPKTMIGIIHIVI